MGLVSRFRHGGVEYPIASSTANALLKDADPALHHAILLLKSVLNKYVGPRLLAQAALEGLDLPSAVEKTIHFEPTPFLLSDQLAFPLFCLYRSEEAWDEHAISHEKETGTWEWAYVLPPMTPRQIEQLHPILRSVAIVVGVFAMQSYDPGYESGKTLRDLAGIQKMWAGPTRSGAFEPVDEQSRWWRAATGKIFVRERNEIVATAFESFEGANIDLDLTEHDGEQVVAFVEIDTFPAPTVESISPASGTKAGSTLVTIVGTGFRIGTTPRVLVGGAYASSVQVTHATTLTCLTPAHDAAPTFAADVQVIDADDQASNVLAAAYTFTTP